MLAAALSIAVAVLLHQMYVVFALIIGFILLFRAEFGPFPVRLRSFAIYGGVSGGLVAGGLCRGLPRALPAASLLLDWARGYAKDTLIYGGPPSLLTPVKGAIGAVSTMLTMNGLMAFDALADRLMAAFPGKSLLEERYLAQTAIAPLLRLPILLAMLGAVAAWLYLAWAAVTDRWRAAQPGGYVDRVLLVAVIVYAVLVMIWEPTNREFWIQTYVFATLWCLRQITRFDGRAPDRRPGPGGLPLYGELRRRPLPALGSALGLLAPLQRGSHRAARRGRSDRDLLLLALLLVPAVFRRGRSALARHTEPEMMAGRLAQTDPARVLISSLAYAPHPLFGIENPRGVQPAWTEAFAARFPPPTPLPATAEDQLFYGFGNGVVRALP